MASIKEIESKKVQIQEYKKQLQLLEEKLHRQSIPEQQRTDFERNINVMKDELHQLEKELKMLHKRNKQAFFLGVITVVCILMIAYNLL